MNPEFFQEAVAELHRSQTTAWIIVGVGFLLALALNGFLFYLTFYRVLIPLTRSLCGFLDAHAQPSDQHNPKPITAPPSDSRYMPKV